METTPPRSLIVTRVRPQAPILGRLICDLRIRPGRFISSRTSRNSACSKMKLRIFRFCERAEDPELEVLVKRKIALVNVIFDMREGTARLVGIAGHGSRWTLTRERSGVRSNGNGRGSVAFCFTTRVCDEKVILVSGCSLRRSHS